MEGCIFRIIHRKAEGQGQGLDPPFLKFKIFSFPKISLEKIF